MKKIMPSAITATVLIVSAIQIIYPSLASAEDIAKADWTEHMKTALPAALCDAKQYFRQCYNITAVECEETAASATRLCLKNNDDKIPDTLNLPADGQKWGAVVGKCTGTTYATVMDKKKIDSKLCNDAENWAPNK